jgi:hypothetical protein
MSSPVHDQDNRDRNVLDDVRHVVATHPDVWNEWREKTRVLEEHVLMLNRHREMWKETVEAIRTSAGPQTEAAWYVHYVRLYVDSQVIALRRINLGSPNRRNNVSLAGLLRDIAAHADVITSSRIGELVELRNPESNQAERAVEWFEREWADGGGRLNPRWPSQDAERLRKQNPRLWALADRSVAHIDVSLTSKETITFGELDEAIDETSRVFQRYWQLLRAGDWIEVRPVLPASWKNLLKRPVFSGP